MLDEIVQTRWNGSAVSVGDVGAEGFRDLPRSRLKLRLGEITQGRGQGADCSCQFDSGFLRQRLWPRPQPPITDAD